MTLQLKRNESPGTGIRRIIRCHIKHVRQRLAEPGDDVDETVHDVRVHCKKIRALLRLARKDLGDDAYRRENLLLRNAARPLTKVRDAEVQVETLDKLIAHFDGRIDDATASTLRVLLQAYSQAVRGRVLKKRQAFNQVMRVIRKASDHSRRWTMNHKGWMALNPGLKRIYKNGYQAFAVAVADPQASRLHEWRKQAKYLWYQMEILQPMQPRVIEKLCRQCHTMTQLLGEDHDLTVLQRTVTAHAGSFSDPDRAAAMIALMKRRQEELREQSFALGRLIYSEKPKQFVARLERYWRVWGRKKRKAGN